MAALLDAASPGSLPHSARHISRASADATRVPADADLLLAYPDASTGSGAVAHLAAALTARGLTVLPGTPLLSAVRLAVPPGTDARVVAADALASGLVAAVEADTRISATRAPDDPLYARMQRRYLDAIHAPEAWEQSTGRAEIVVAIVDTGVDATHPDLVGRIAQNSLDAPNGRDDDANGCVDDVSGCSFVSLESADPSCGYRVRPPIADASDDEGHGTFVAGIAAAAGNNGVGTAGIAWNVRILPVKVLDCTATGRISDAAVGIRYAARAGASVINVSFGALTDSRALRDAVAEAQDVYGAVIVASAGNDASWRVTYPARYPGVIAVGGSGERASDGTIDFTRFATFSVRGPDLSVIAPAIDLVAPVPAFACTRGVWACIDHQPYAQASGTSFATPLVAGAVALVRSRWPGISNGLARQIVLANARTVRYGDAPLLDVAAALTPQLYESAAPGTGRADAGTPPGPAGADVRGAGSTTPAR